MKTVNLTPLFLLSRPKRAKGKEVMSGLVSRAEAAVEAFNVTEEGAAKAVQSVIQKCLNRSSLNQQVNPKSQHFWL
jgi:hypothetical protein